MIYFLDAEFIENGKTIDLIDIGITNLSGKEIYLLNWDCDYSKASDWVKENVLAALPPKPDEPQGWWIKKQDMASIVKDYITLNSDNNKPEFWGEWCSYDWVAFCQIFGTMMDLPSGFPMYCNDIIQFSETHLGIPTNQLPPSLETPGKHNGLLGARTVKMRWSWLVSKQCGNA